MFNLLKFLPKNHLSRLVGVIVHWQGPSFLVHWMIRQFAKSFQINLEESEKAIDQYPSLGEFFIRRLKPGMRPVANSWAVHPADSVITQSGLLGEKGTLIQAKGKSYQVSELLQQSDWQKKYLNGFFATYYLCPTDYHRVHAPVSGKIKSVTHIPGQLWPVNNWSVLNIDNLFSINERVVVEIETELGFVAVVFVGATNVGQICLSFENNYQTNRGQNYGQKLYNPGLQVNIGDELGYFRMGSTVVMVYNSQFVEKYQNQLKLGPQVKVGQALI